MPEGSSLPALVNLVLPVLIVVVCGFKYNIPPAIKNGDPVARLYVPDSTNLQSAIISFHAGHLASEDDRSKLYPIA